MANPQPGAQLHSSDLVFTLETRRVSVLPDRRASSLSGELRPKVVRNKTNQSMTPINSQLSLVIKCAIAVGLVAGFTGCQCCKPKKERANNDGVIEIVGPGGTSGTLIIAANIFQSSGGTQCFPTSQGWDKYYPLPKFFLGPNTTPDANSYTNANNTPSVTVQTCDPSNGTTLQTGILIQAAFNPIDKVCVTNSPACIPSPKLTIATRSLANNTKYKATVFYKSSTLGSLTNVTVNWSYP